MHPQIVSSAAVTPNFAEFPLSRPPGSPSANHLAAIGLFDRKTSGEMLFAEGDQATSVFEIVHGVLRIVKLLPDGRRQITGFLSAGYLAGLAPEGVHVYSAEAVTEVTLRRYRRAAFERLIDEAPGFAKKLLAVTSHELRQAQDQMLLLGRKTAAERIASFLLIIMDRQDSDGSQTVDVPMTRSDIADYLGLTVETVSRTLTKLKHDRFIALLTPSRMKILNLEGLKELAAGSYGTDL